MAAVAGVINPSGSSIFSDQLIVYYVNANNNLALTALPLGATDGNARTYSASSTNVKGYVANPSALAVAPVNNMIGIYGVVIPAVASGACKDVGTTGNIALLSPVLQPLGATCEATYGVLATSCDPNHGRAWIYYRKLADATKSTTPAPTIYQASLTSISSSLGEEVAYDGRSNSIDPRSYLAAYYDTNNDERHIIFQKNDETVHDYNIDLDKTDNTNASPKQTPSGIAAIYVPEKLNTYLYFVMVFNPGDDARYQLWKTVRTETLKNDQWEIEWGQPVKVTPIVWLNENTQLHVTALTAKKENYITFKNEAKDLACIHDPW